MGIIQISKRNDLRLALHKDMAKLNSCSMYHKRHSKKGKKDKTESTQWEHKAEL